MVLWQDGRALSTPRPIQRDAAGAAELAQMYALPSDRTTVRAMMNTTIDGAIAGADGTSGSLRNDDDAFLFGVLRALTDAVVVGAETVRSEDYRRPLGRADLRAPSRRPSGAPRPVLAIWSSSGNLPSSIQADWPTFLLTPPEHCEQASTASGIPAAQVLPAADAAAGIRALEERGLRGIQAEGGPSALARLAAEDLLDELCFSVSHRTVGGPSPRVMHGPALEQDWELVSLIVGPDATLSRYRRAR